MKLDGEPLGKVLVGTYAYADRPAGPTTSGHSPVPTECAEVLNLFRIGHRVRFAGEW